jgi:uncharacterized DUF497 family protein
MGATPWLGFTFANVACTLTLNYEWDERKRVSNLEKHQVDFTTMRDFEWDTAVVDSNDHYGEIRFAAVGYVGSRLYVAVYTVRNTAMRIISMRERPM